jgi:hypothetical protein
MARKKQAAAGAGLDDPERIRRQRLRDTGGTDPEALALLEEISGELRADQGGDRRLSRTAGKASADVQRELVAVVIRSGMNRAFAYACVKSGYLVTAPNVASVPREVRDSWNQAIIEWRVMSALERASTIQALLSPGQD